MFRPCVISLRTAHPALGVAMCYTTSVPVGFCGEFIVDRIAVPYLLDEKSNSFPRSRASRVSGGMETGDGLEDLGGLDVIPANDDPGIHPATSAPDPGDDVVDTLEMIERENEALRHTRRLY